MTAAENPYAPPPTPTGGSGDDALYVFDNGLFVVDTARKIPGVCLKCASTERIERREERMAVSTSGSATGALGGVMGAAVASTLRNARELIVPAIVGAALVVGVVAWVVHLRTPRVDVKLSLCADCNDAWNQGVNYRRGLLAALAAVGVGAALGFSLDEMALVALMGLAFVIVLVVAVGMKLPPRFITARRLVDTRLHLFGVGAAVPDAIRQRRAARAAKKAARRDASTFDADDA